jgi:hypothetical protein
MSLCNNNHKKICDHHNKNGKLMLKILAIVLMTVDHADRIIFDQQYEILTILGRFAFPLFAFMIARNALYTSKPGNYIGMLFLFGIISQPVFAFALDHPLLDPLNVLFTLGLGVLAIQALRQGIWWALPFIIGAGWFVDYSIEGVAVMPVIAFTIHSLRTRGIEHPLTLLGSTGVLALACCINSWSYVPYVIVAFLIGFLTLLPNVETFERRLQWKRFKLFFYAYYPGHLALLTWVFYYNRVAA